MEDESYQYSKIKQDLDEIILERSKFLLTKKFEKYSSQISKIYSQFNINKSRRIDVLGSPQIDVNYLDQVIILILKEVNLFLLELSSPKDIFISFFLITSQKENEMEGIIKIIQHEIVSKNLTEKYNNIFYEEKIKPMFIKYHNNNHINNYNDLQEDEVVPIINIAEYNTKGKKIKTMNELLEENENVIKKYNIIFKSESQNKSFNKSINNINNNISISFSFSNDLSPNTLYIETLPQILIDYLKENPNLAFVEIDEEFTKELKSYNKNLLYKIKEYDEIYSKNKNLENNIKMVGKELNQHTLQLKQVQKSIDLYKQIIMDKKQKRENTIFLEDMLNKLIEREREIINKINEIKENSYVINMQEKFNKYNSFQQNRFKENNYNLIQNLDLSSSKNIDNININNIRLKEIPKLSLNNSKFNLQNIQSQNNIIKKYKLSQSTTNINKIPKLSKFNIINNESQMQYMNNNINSINNYNKNALTTKNSILKTISSKEKDNQMYTDSKSKRITTLSVELSPDLIENALKEIFSFFSSLNNSNNVDDLDNNNFITYDLFKKFCNDFKIFISQSKIESIFYESLFDSNDDNNNKNKMNYSQFKLSLSKLSLELHEIKKQKLKKIINDKKSIINYMELREYLRQEEEKNHNKFTEKITGGIAKKSLEKNQFEFLSKYKKLKSDITKFEFDYEKELKKSEQKILDNFYVFLGIGNDTYKNKIKLKENVFVENALKKYGYMDIFKNFINNNSNISNSTGYSNYFNNNTNRNNSLTLRITKKNLFKNNFNNNIKSANLNNNNYNFINNINTNKINLNKVQNKFLENNNKGNNRYNLKSIEELEEVDSKAYNNYSNKKMNKNFSAFSLGRKGLNNINSMNINLLPSINNINNGNNSNIRYNYNFNENNNM